MSRAASSIDKTCSEPEIERTLSVTIAQELAKRMIEHCKCRGVDMSGAVAKALDLYLESCTEEELEVTLDSCC